MRFTVCAVFSMKELLKLNSPKGLVPLYVLWSRTRKHELVKLTLRLASAVAQMAIKNIETY